MVVYLYYNVPDDFNLLLLLHCKLIIYIFFCLGMVGMFWGQLKDGKETQRFSVSICSMLVVSHYVPNFHLNSMNTSIMLIIYLLHLISFETVADSFVSEQILKINLKME